MTPYYILQILYGAEKIKEKNHIFTTPTLYFYSFQSRTTKNRCNTHFHTNIADECRTYLTLQRGDQLHQYIKYTLIIISSYLSLLLLQNAGWNHGHAVNTNWYFGWKVVPYGLPYLPWLARAYLFAQ